MQLANLLASQSKLSFTSRIKLMSHPMISINDNHCNPIWVRPFDQKSPKSIAGVGIVGHTSTHSGLCKTMYNPLSRSYLIGIDIQASWLYRIKEKPCHARARLIYADPKTGHLLHLRLSNEKHCFFEGEFRPSKNKQHGIFNKLKKYIMSK